MRLSDIPDPPSAANARRHPRPFNVKERRNIRIMEMHFSKKNGIVSFSMLGLSSLLFVGCSISVSKPEEVKEELVSKTGTRNCKECVNIKYHESRIIDSQRAYGDGTNRDTQFLTLDYKFVLTNRSIFRLSDSYEIQPGSYSLRGLSPSEDGNRKHPYRFLLNIRRSASYSQADSQIYYIDKNGKFTVLEPAYVKDAYYPNSGCGSYGCTSTASYIVPPEAVDMAIQMHQPIELLFGGLHREKVGSKDGYEPSYEKGYKGLFVTIKPEYVSAFIEAVNAVQSR